MDLNSKRPLINWDVSISYKIHSPTAIYPPFPLYFCTTGSSHPPTLAPWFPPVGSSWKWSAPSCTMSRSSSRSPPPRRSWRRHRRSVFALLTPKTSAPRLHAWPSAHYGKSSIQIEDSRSVLCPQFQVRKWRNNSPFWKGRSSMVYRPSQTGLRYCIRSHGTWIVVVPLKTLSERVSKNDENSKKKLARYGKQPFGHHCQRHW